MFDNGKLNDVYRSFIDAIITELVLPDSKYPLHILLGLLHQCLEEAPREDKRFPQGMWDAVGDLSVRMLESMIFSCHSLETAVYGQVLGHV